MIDEHDTAAIYEALTEPGAGGSRGITPSDRRIYAAGVKAGMERAARLCDVAFNNFGEGGDWEKCAEVLAKVIRNEAIK